MSSTNTREIDDNEISALLSALKHFTFGSSIYDAFARLRVSTPTTLFESKQIVSEQNLLWDVGQVSGAGGSAVYSRPRASTTLSVTANTAGRFVRRTRRYFNYQPGKSQLVLMSAVMGPKQQGINRRIGYFDDANGIFFGVNHESLYCAVRSSVSGVPVTILSHQGEWNIDAMDGTGPSGIVLDTTRCQVYWFDFEWLGVGRVRYGIFYRGLPYPMHEFNCANEPGCHEVYMSTPALPMSAEIENDGTGAAASMETICSGIMSEGGDLLQGALRSVSRGNVVLSNTAVELVPLISIRSRTGFEFSTIDINSLNVITISNAAFRWALILNPTIAGVDPAVWTPVPSSAVEFDIARTQANTLTGGIVIEEGYSSDQQRLVEARLTSYLGIGKRLLPSSPKDQMVLAVQNIGGNNMSYYGALRYQESV